MFRRPYDHWKSYFFHIQPTDRHRRPLLFFLKRLCIFRSCIFCSAFPAGPTFLIFYHTVWHHLSGLRIEVNTFFKVISLVFFWNSFNHFKTNFRGLLQYFAYRRKFLKLNWIARFWKTIKVLYSAGTEDCLLSNFLSW